MDNVVACHQKTIQKTACIIFKQMIEREGEHFPQGSTAQVCVSGMVKAASLQHSELPQKVPSLSPRTILESESIQTQCGSVANTSRSCCSRCPGKAVGRSKLERGRQRDIVAGGTCEGDVVSRKVVDEELPEDKGLLEIGPHSTFSLEEMTVIETGEATLCRAYSKQEVGSRGVVGEVEVSSTSLTMSHTSATARSLLY